MLKIPAAALDHRRFWDAMDRVAPARLDAVEEALTRRMVEVFALDTHALILDMTNFATFVDSTNDRAPVAQRGKAKQNATTCAWSAWGWSPPATAVSRCCLGSTPVTAPTSPSSPQ
jgi:hypothetical protein